MKFEIKREQLLAPIQRVIGAVERRQTLAILSNVLVQADGERLLFTASDLELELVSNISHEAKTTGETTVPARKLLDICRTLPEQADINFSVEEDRAILQSGRSRFILSTMPPEDFPTLDELPEGVSTTIAQSELRKVAEGTAFAMAQQDVRYYLNGLLLELAGSKFRCVATDGHRLSLCDAQMHVQVGETLQAIVPRKGVHELVRLLAVDEVTCQIRLTSNHIQVTLPQVRFTSKLIDGRFPDYHRVLPEPGDNILIVDRKELREALTRTAILSNEKYKGIKMNLADGRLEIQTHNPDREEAEAVLDVEYAGGPLEVGFNVVYLLDVLAALEGERVKFTLGNASGGCVVTDEHNDCCRHVVMPMRL